jgi:hypothetical protein
VLSVDEKSQFQAPDRTQPGLPLKKGRAGAGRKTFVTQLREYASSRESSWRGLDPGFNAKLKRGAPELSEFDRRNVAAVCLGSMVSVPLRRGPMNVVWSIYRHLPPATALDGRRGRACRGGV